MSTAGCAVTHIQDCHIFKKILMAFLAEWLRKKVNLLFCRND